MIQREPIYAALYARLSAVAGLVTKSRRLKHWADTPAEEQPALFQSQVREVATASTSLPTQWALHLDVYVYVRASLDSAPSEVLNPLLDSICAALAQDGAGPNGRCTLGGLVHNARISGSIETDEGTLGEQAVAIIPVEILVND